MIELFQYSLTNIVIPHHDQFLHSVARGPCGCLDDSRTNINTHFSVQRVLSMMLQLRGVATLFLEKNITGLSFH